MRVKSFIDASKINHLYHYIFTPMSRILKATANWDADGENSQIGRKKGRNISYSAVDIDLVTNMGSETTTVIDYQSTPVPIYTNMNRTPISQQ